MARLIEIQSVRHISGEMSVRAGDVLHFKATGGHVQSGGEVVELLGAFVPSILGENGEILTPMGAPNTVLFRALRPGRATIDLVTGDPWHATHTTSIALTIE
jgi:hypothetical protein